MAFQKPCIGASTACRGREGESGRERGRDPEGIERWLEGEISGLHRYNFMYLDSHVGRG